MPRHDEFVRFLSHFPHAAAHPAEDLLSAKLHLEQATNAPTLEDHVHHLQAGIECALRWSKAVGAEARRQHGAGLL